MIDRRGLLVGAAVGLASASALAQDDKAKLRDTLLELEIASWQYTKDKNAAAMNGFLADDAVLIFYDGSRYTKAQMVKFDFEVASFTRRPQERRAAGRDARRGDPALSRDLCQRHEGQQARRPPRSAPPTPMSGAAASG